MMSFHLQVDKEVHVLLLGFANAGKTTIVKQLTNVDISQIRTDCADIKSLICDGIHWNVGDIGGEV